MKNNYQTIEKIIQKLKDANHTISFAESCSGGLVATSFTSVSGASSIFNGSVVVYANTLKHRWLNVELATLENHGAVSTECVREMLEGIITLAQSDYAIAISGIAGPAGGTEKKPVGTVYIGLQTPTDQEVFSCFFKGNREYVQEQSTAFALEKLEEYLKI